MPKKSIIFNWKMNPAKPTEALKLFAAADKSVSGLNIYVAPPFVYLDKLSHLTSSARLMAQDVFYETAGAFTGEVSTAMLKSLGVKSVLIGHSERRWLIGESDDIVARKLSTALAFGLKATLCVGELKQTSLNDSWSFIKQQLKLAVADLSEPELKHLSLAYEPVWAIGTGREASLAHSEHISDKLKNELGFNIPVLYGGSVTPENITLFLDNPLLDGVLVGGASLKVASVKTILQNFS